MNKFFRAIIAAWGAKKLGGGCLSTIVIFIIIYVALGKCNNTRAASHPEKSRPVAVCSSPVKQPSNR
ncbi:hypothetical protein [Mucilaginibacter pocheonensis]|uniref:Membrane protein n=1 Tax=Mucilaginibacter pocheonensis TaxID=398050 RepID=A0ABU1TAM0_9SPHI|nr:hypothetical protein [Mucilaginibacter pocheonensis]MDR6941880.1 putative membrane protein [Mucilaginibacter pocheonensis]